MMSAKPLFYYFTFLANIEAPVSFPQFRFGITRLNLLWIAPIVILVKILKTSFASTNGVKRIKQEPIAPITLLLSFKGKWQLNILPFYEEIIKFQIPFIRGFGILVRRRNQWVTARKAPPQGVAGSLQLPVGVQGHCPWWGLGPSS